MIKVVILLSLSLFGCAQVTAPRGGSLSMGHPARGTLSGASALPDRGTGFVRARPGEGTRFGTEELVGAITRAARSVSRTFGGRVPLVVGDLSSRFGGQHPRHGSHRTGRDADLLFYAKSIDGRAIRGSGWFAFGRHATAFGHPRAPVIDLPRNWHLVRTLLRDRQARVQWLFCSDDVKTRLLRYATANEPLAEVIARATWVLHQPSVGNPHRDHFHLRVGCSEAQSALGCIDGAPRWPWLYDASGKLSPDKRTRLDDQTLVDLMTRGLGQFAINM